VCSHGEPQLPLIQSLLRCVKALPTLDDLEGPNLEAEAELEEDTSILIDSALVCSGFKITNSNMCDFLQLVFGLYVFGLYALGCSLMRSCGSVQMT